MRPVLRGAPVPVRDLSRCYQGLIADLDRVECCSYILSLAVNDFTSQIWLSGFNEIGEQLFERTANEMQELKDEDEPQFSAIVQNQLGKMFNFNVKAKADSFGDTTRVRYQAQRMATVDFVAAGKEMYETCMNGWN